MEKQEEQEQQQEKELEKLEQEPEQRQGQKQEKDLEKQELVQEKEQEHELQHSNLNPDPKPSPKLNSPAREQELQQTQPSSLPKVSSPPRLPYHNSKPQLPRLPFHTSKPQSPPLEERDEHYNHNSNPQSPPLDERDEHSNHNSKPQSPPLDDRDEHYNHNSKPQSPPLDDRHEQYNHNSKPQSPPLCERGEHYNRPPFKPPPTALAFETKPGPTSLEVSDEERGPGADGDAHVNTGSGRRYLKANISIQKRAKRDSMLKKALIVSRICGFVFSLVSFSVLAADRDRGWALDSFYHYKELRYCMAVNVIAFLYSGFQGYDLAYQLTSGKRKLRKPLGYYLDFSVDQMLTYLLMSASSSAAVRVDDWQSNWGKDEFPEMARASVAISFFAFVAFALSSLISGYTVCTLKSL